MPVPTDGFMASRFAAPPLYEQVFDQFKREARAQPTASAGLVVVMVADRMGISVQQVVEACAIVHSLNAARGQFEKNELP